MATAKRSDSYVCCYCSGLEIVAGTFDLSEDAVAVADWGIVAHEVAAYCC